LIKININLQRIGDVQTISLIPDEDMALLNIKSLEFNFYGEKYKHFELCVNGHKWGF